MEETKHRRLVSGQGAQLVESHVRVSDDDDEICRDGNRSEARTAR